MIPLDGDAFFTSQMKLKSADEGLLQKEILYQMVTPTTLLLQPQAIPPLFLGLLEF